MQTNEQHDSINVILPIMQPESIQVLRMKERLYVVGGMALFAALKTEA
jgi:hypothetical protein